MTPENNNAELRRMLAALQAENEKLKATGKTTEGGLKVSTKGCVSLYGITGRFPATHYPEHWIGILERRDQILGFLRDHVNELKWKSIEAKEAFLKGFAAPPTPREEEVTEVTVAEAV